MTSLSALSNSLGHKSLPSHSSINGMNDSRVRFVRLLNCHLLNWNNR